MFNLMLQQPGGGKGLIAVSLPILDAMPPLPPPAPAGFSPLPLDVLLPLGSH